MLDVDACCSGVYFAADVGSYVMALHVTFHCFLMLASERCFDAVSFAFGKYSLCFFLITFSVFFFFVCCNFSIQLWFCRL